ncbi:MAG: putative 4-hydroxybenzoate polyprenyltransferase [Pirellulaceae bacterium]|nr:putative 4-hydroxybenzoate polyprenyltransferase [Pirellulaceae bacterium]
MFQKIQLLLEMIRFSHTLFALPFAILAAVMAWNVPAPTTLTDMSPDLASSEEIAQILAFRWQELVGILLCMVFARSAAMAFNRLVDQKIDGENARTAMRHLPAGTLSPRTVWLFTFVNSVGFILSTLLFLPNTLPALLSIPVLIVLLFYSLTKRFTSLAHFWLGFSLMLAPISAWIAIRGEIVVLDLGDLLPPFLLGLIVLFWVSGFDIIYSCQDADFDKKARLNSIPVLLGVGGALRFAALCHLIMVGLLFLFPILCEQLSQLGWLYYTGIVAVSLLLAYEHSLVRPDDLSKVNLAFFNVNTIISVGLLILISADLLLV